MFCNAISLHRLICNAWQARYDGPLWLRAARDAVDARSYPMDVISSLPCIVNSRDQGWRYDVIRGHQSACVFMRCFVWSWHVLSASPLSTICRSAAFRVFVFAGRVRLLFRWPAFCTRKRACVREPGSLRKDRLG
jgi:hypothetical protein